MFKLAGYLWKGRSKTSAHYCLVLFSRCSLFSRIDLVRIKYYQPVMILWHFYQFIVFLANQVSGFLDQSYLKKECTHILLIVSMEIDFWKIKKQKYNLLMFDVAIPKACKDVPKWEEPIILKNIIIGFGSILISE